jgi:hypothetical protein
MSAGRHAEFGAIQLLVRNILKASREILLGQPA